MFFLKARVGSAHKTERCVGRLLALQGQRRSSRWPRGSCNHLEARYAVLVLLQGGSDKPHCAWSSEDGEGKPGRTEASSSSSWRPEQYM